MAFLLVIHVILGLLELFLILNSRKINQRIFFLDDYVQNYIRFVACSELFDDLSNASYVLIKYTIIIEALEEISNFHAK